MIYLDTSALVKLIFEEKETDALVQFLEENRDLPKLTSELSIIELIRTCLRRDETTIANGRQLLEGLDKIPISSTIIEHSAMARPVELRSLDSIHLASALLVKESLNAFVAYDRRLLDAASSVGILAISPE